jgi:hypothetical protein
MTEAPVTGSPVAPAGTASPQVTLGELAARSKEAWSAVRSFRVTFRGETRTVAPMATPAGATPVASPLASPVSPVTTSFVSVRDVVLPDQQRQSVTGLGETDHEAIVSGERLFVRGPLARQLDPAAPPDAWVAIDPATLPEGSALSILLGGLPAAPGAPLSSLPERLSPQVVRHLDTVTFDGRECDIYGAADTIPTTGSRVDYAIALDQRDLPCFIETSAAGLTHGRDEFTEINAALTIATPSAATPVRVPPMLASPFPHD